MGDSDLQENVGPQVGAEPPSTHGLQPPQDASPLVINVVSEGTVDELLTSVRPQTPLSCAPEIITTNNEQPRNQLNWPFCTALNTLQTLPWRRLDLHDFLLQGKF